MVLLGLHARTKKPWQEQCPASLPKLQLKHNSECPAKKDEFRPGPSQSAAVPQVPAVKEKNMSKEQPTNTRK